MFMLLLLTLLCCSFGQQFGYLPNLPLLGRGYNIIRGNPQASQTDPGFVPANIFIYTYFQNATWQNFYVPDSVAVSLVDTCSFELETKTIPGETSFIENLNASLTADNSNPGTAVNRWLLASFTGSDGFREIANETTQYQDVLVSGQVQCPCYLVSQGTFKTPLSEEFLDAVGDLLQDLANPAVIGAFVTKFGTHYVRNFTVGSAFSQVTSFNRTMYDTLSDGDFDFTLGALASFKILTGQPVTPQEKKAFLVWLASAESVDNNILGVIPPADGSWQSWEKSSFLNPSPFEYDLQIISALLNNQYFPHVDPKVLTELRGQVHDYIMGLYCTDVVGAACTGPKPDPHVSSMELIGVLSQQRSNVAATVLEANLLFAGGSDPSGSPTYTMDVYNIKTSNWSVVYLPEARSCLAAAVTKSMVLFAGGCNAHDLTDRVLIYAPKATPQWQYSQLSEPRAQIVTVSLGTKLLFAGGCYRINCYAASPVVDIYYPATNSWGLHTLSKARQGIVGIGHSKKAYFAGGIGTNVVDIYDEESESWTTEQLSTPRSHLAAVTFDDKIYFIGGLTASRQVSNVVDIYDPSANSWSTDAIPYPNFSVEHVKSNGKMLILQGVSPRTQLPQIVFYRPKEKQWGKAICPDCDFRWASAVVVHGNIYTQKGPSKAHNTTDRQVFTFSP